MSNNEFLLEQSIRTLHDSLSTAQVVERVFCENQCNQWKELINRLEEIQHNGITEETKTFVWDNYNELIKAGLTVDDLTCAASNFEHTFTHTNV
jgi:hypothetical protein